MVKKNVESQTVFGLPEDTEIIYLEVMPISKIMDYPLDYSMTGMILGALIS